METRLKNIPIRLNILLNPKVKTGQTGQTGQSRIVVGLGPHTNTLQKRMPIAATGVE